MFNKKILITGRKGQIGYELLREMTLFGNIIDTDFDLANKDSIVANIRKFQPDIVLNCAAYTAVDTAEECKEYAHKVNAIAPGIINEEVQKYNGLFVHFSTDYAYDGYKDLPYKETDLVNPLSEYGKSKVAGDNAIISVGGSYLIFRTGWLYGSRGRNFLKTMLELCESRNEFKVFNDLFGAPTWSRTLASAVGYILRDPKAFSKEYAGIYNLTSSGYTDWYEFAVSIAEYYEKKHHKRIKVLPDSSTNYPMKAKRPKRVMLDNTKIFETFSIKMPHWRTSFNLVMEELGYFDQYKNYR